ncbi:MAG: phosphonate C-P lyase system protein PhnH [Caldilineaceae bacterium]|nr:phosphonate C-P lyase system protein PhnH [Caldilineaceae bacterium]
MWALSYPGRIFQLPPMSLSPLRPDMPQPLQPFVTIAHTLLDLEVRYFTPIAALDQLLTHTSARAVNAAKADYHFYPYVNFLDDEDHLEFVEQAKTGDMLYPDQSATLVIACRLNGAGTDGQRLRLTGPGIQTVNELTVAGIPSHFWTLRAEMIHYPLGVDLILVDDQQVAGLPRTTVLA